MPRDLSVRSALDLIASSKITERQEGLELLTEICSNANNCRSLQNTPDGTGWLQVFQYMFVLVKTERAAALKGSKTSKAAISRLQVAAGKVRWLVEVSYPYLTNKPLVALYTHLNQSIVHDGGLVEYISTDYIKALKVLLNFPAHLEHLDETTWRYLMSIVWDVVLDGRVEHDRDDWDAEAQETFETAGIPTEDESEDEGGTMKPRPGSSAVKRTRTSKSTGSSDLGTLPRRKYKTLSADATDLLSLFPVLLSSSSAPILPRAQLRDPDDTRLPHRAGIPLLRRVFAFFERYPSETNSHKPVLQGLNILLRELELNAIDEMTRMGARMFPLLVKLWSTRDLTLRDHVLVALRKFAPFLSREKQRSAVAAQLTHARSLSQSAADTDGDSGILGERMTAPLAEAMHELQTLIFKDAGTKRGTLPLDLAALHLRLPESDTGSKPRLSLEDPTFPLQSSIIRAGPSFTARLTASWATLELNADCCFKLHQVPDTVENSRLVGSAPATKRIKKNDRTNPILALAPFVQTSRQPESRMLALQTLYFVIERHWSDLFLDVQAEILSQLLSLTKDSDLNIQQWTFVCLASVSTKRRSEASREFGDRNTAMNGTVAILNRTGDEESIWQEVWTIALRRTNLASGTACRGACLMVHALMLSGTVTDASISTALSGFFEEIISQGPAYTSDAVCAFVKVALDYAERDTKLYRLDHHQKVIAWFRYNWRIAQDIRTGTNAVSTSLTPEAVELLAKVAGSSDTPTMWIETPLIASDVFQHMTEELETSPIRQYLLYAALPIEQASRSTEHRFPLGVKLDTLEGTATQSNLKKTRQILELLHDTVKDVSTTIDLASALKMKNLIDLSIFTILVSAVITSSQEDPEHIAAETACDLLERVLAHTFKESNHGAHERAMILSSLTPILSSSGPRRVRDSRSEMWPTLTLPDGRAGVTTLPSSEQPEALDHSDHPLTDRLLVTVWRIARLSEVFQAHAGLFRQYLASGQGSQGLRSLVGDTTRQGDDDFGPIRQEEDGGVASDGDGGENLPFTRGYSIVVRALTDPAYYASGMQIGTRDVELYNILIESEEYNTYILGQAIFEAIGEQRLVLTRKALSSLVELVTDVLKIYVYKRLPATRQLVYQFLSATLYTWIDVEESVASAAEELLPLWHWCSDYLTTGKLDAWQDRYRIITLFDEVVLRDPSETRWLAEGMTDGEQETPSQVMLRSLEDCDIRVRFRLATSVPRLLQLDMPIASKPSSFYLKVARYFRFQGRDKEFILSRAILMTNVVIASSGARRAPFFHLYDTVAGHPSLHTHIETAFSAITRLLQLASFSRLYLEYATRLLAAQGREDQDPLHIPVSLYGFQSRAVWARETIGTAGASLLLSPECEGFWESLVELAQVDKADTLHHNVSTAIAMAAGMKALADADGQAFRAELARLKARFSRSTSRPKSKWVFQKSETASMVATLFQLADESISPAEIHQSFLQGSTQETVRQAAIYKALLFPNDYDLSMDLEETITPKNSAQEVLRGIQLLANEFDLDLRLIACNTIMQIMCKISASCLLNERRRLVYSLALLIATYPDTIMEPEIFDLLLRAVACLYEQPDLGRLMVSFLAWILEQLLDGSARCKAPVPVLSGLAQSAKRYTEGPKGLTSTGHDALSLMETFMNRLLREDAGTSDPWRSKLGQQIARLLPLWPRTLPEGLERKVSRLTYGQLRDQASHTDVTAGKFTLSKQLARFAQARLPASAYRKSTFWHLRSSIASAPELSHEDMEAFMLLAYTCDGLAEIPTHETIEKLKGSAGVEIGLLQPLSRKSEPTAASKRRILSLLLDDMRGTSLTRVSPAYRALAGICATAPEIHQSAELDPVSQGQLTLLASNVPSPRRDALKMDDLTDATMDRGPYAESHKDAKGWSSNFGRLIVQELASAPAYAALSYLLDIMTMSDELIDDLIPPLLHLLLDLEMRTTPQQAPNRQIISGYFNWLLARKETARSCSLNIVHSVLYLRNFSPAQSTVGSRPLAWLELDLRAVSVAALRCKLPETALLFWELHRDGASDNSELEEDDLSLLYEIYDSVEEPDGFYGVPLAGDARSAVLKRLHHEEDWTQAFSYHGASFEISDARNGALPLVARSLRAFGFDTLAGTLLREVANDGGHMPLDLAWRTRQWDVPVEALVNSAAERPGASVYRTLRSVHHARDTSQAWSVARTALSEAFNTFGSIGLEDMAGIRQGLKTLLCLREVDLWFADLLPLVHLEDFAHDKWRAFRTLPANMEYPMADDILNVRLSLLHAAKASEGPQIGDLLSIRTAGLVSVERDCLTALGALARAKGDLSGAVTALTRVQNLTQADANDHSTEFAEVLWLQGQHGLALEQLKRLLRTKNYARPSKPQEFWLRANVLSLLGQWTAEAKQATEIDIREDYFKPSQTAIYHAEKGISAQQMAGVLLRYAQFADQQFQAMSQSEQIKQLKPHHARQMAEYEALCHHRTKAARDDPVVYEALRSLKQECQRDKERLNKHELDRLEFLRVALLTYAKVIATTDSHDNLVLRFCAIWLATESDADTNVYIRKALKDIPSHKFVDLAYQLTARLHPNEEGASHFHLNLYDLVTRICAEHPFHMAYQVITLAAPAVRSSRRMSTNVGDRERAAFTLLAQVRTSTSRSVEIDQLERFAKCAIAWAREDNGKRGKDGYYLPTKDSVILSLRDMVIPVPTANVPTDPTMAYKNIARLRAYEPRFSVAGGIHHPKIMTCWGSDGREYRELFKAGDDTRQDTIMEQLFKLVNDLLDTDSETRRRKLHMRTYNVLTLAEETGVIQFVTQTIPLAEYLMSAHDRYHPDDMKVKEFRESMRLIQSGDDPNRNQKLVETFKENRKRFRPVMRNLFIEKKKEPLSWFAMRLAYSRSLAVSNIVGYIVGIGDRHCSNILIDHSSGEMVHIDFGVAFGQGRALPIPELVPFRLTADLVDALGSFGTQGVYQRCSENTLRVMRNTSEHILAILEVFKHDPLHRWKITAETMKKVQDGLPVQRKSSKSASEIGDRASGHADQALADVINKLDQRMSVEYTVNEWNRNAQAPANLAVIFVGWQPWL